MVQSKVKKYISVDGTINNDKLLQLITRHQSEKCFKIIQDVNNKIQTITDNYEHLLIAEILADLNVDEHTICVGMLYFSENLELAENFGTELYSLATKFDDLPYTLVDSSNINKNNIYKLRKMIFNSINDIRVILIKLACHLYNMRTATKYSHSEKIYLAELAKIIYIPLANSLGIGQIKWELEDFTFRFEDPTIYQHIAELLDEKRVNRDNYIDKIQKQIGVSLKEQNIEAEISGRAKHIYSIWRKMQRKKIGYYELYDIRAIRIIVKNLQECYAVLGIVHNIWQHIPQEFDDYIATPKKNGYQSLHTAVIAADGKFLEVQIRTEEMHNQAELGIAAHWVYKDGVAYEQRYLESINKLRNIISSQDIDKEISDDMVYLFTPEGDVIDLPCGATPIDFAYNIHTEVGHHCRGAKVNGKIVSLSYKLKNGEKVEIITSKEGGPSRDWVSTHLNFVCTAKARSKIQQWFRQQDKSINAQFGREKLFHKEFKRLSIDLAGIQMENIIKAFNDCKTEEDLFASIGCGNIKMSQIFNIIQKTNKLFKYKNIRKTTKKDIGTVNIDGVGNFEYNLAKCCTPMAGDPIIGYVTLGRGVSIHKKDCLNMLNIQNKLSENNARLLKVSWGGAKQEKYLVDIKISSYDRPGLLKDITNALSQKDVDIVSMKTVTKEDAHIATFDVNLQITSMEYLELIFALVEQVDNVFEVRRIVK